MMLRKGCPRCQGDLYLDRSEGPTMLTCLQCGRSFAHAALNDNQHDTRVAAAAGDRAA